MGAGVWRLQGAQVRVTQGFGLCVQCFVRLQLLAPAPPRLHVIPVVGTVRLTAFPAVEIGRRAGAATGAPLRAKAPALASFPDPARVLGTVTAVDTVSRRDRTAVAVCAEIHRILRVPSFNVLKVECTWMTKGGFPLCPGRRRPFRGDVAVRSGEPFLLPHGAGVYPAGLSLRGSFEPSSSWNADSTPAWKASQEETGVLKGNWLFTRSETRHVMLVLT